MSFRLMRQMNILQPIDQAARCLKFWLAQENRKLSPAKQRRLSGLLARHFIDVEDLPDEIMLSFLDHYSAKQQEVALDDPYLIREEIKNILDQSDIKRFSKPKFYLRVALSCFAVAFFLWSIGGIVPLSAKQQNHLRVMVHQVAETDPDLTKAGIWSQVKKPLGVSRYQDMSLRDYYLSRYRLRRWGKE